MRASSSNSRLRWYIYASGVVSLIGIVFLVVFYIGFLNGSEALQTFGPLNDICIIIQYLLILPVLPVLYRLFRDDAPVLSIAAMLIGVAGIIAVVVLQVLLVTGVLTFEQQVGPVSIALLVVGLWILSTGSLGRSSGKLPGGLAVSILAMFYVGYPFWAFWLGRRLVSGESTVAEASRVMTGETA